VSAVAAFIVLGVVFRSLERRYARGPLRPFWRRDRLLDFGWLLFNSILTQPVVSAVVLLSIVQWSLLTGVELRELSALGEVLHGRSWVSRWPLAAQVVVGLVLADFIGYWTHRMFHRGALWRAHAIHHSARTLDWLSAVRNHPLNELLGALCVGVPLVILGFAPAVFASVSVILGLHGLLLHTDVPWDFGPLRYVLASPRFHRWHHTSQREGQDKNFAGLFPVWDLAFGTFYLPRDRSPVSFGVDGVVPTTFFAQLVHGLRGR
jgi:sterol desaturase/sphingolipid hydroxylase (fatty acid hydroxylase superfamily)